MDWQSVQESDLVGISHIELIEQGTPGYYKTLDYLRPLFKSLQPHASGYYVNRICNETSNEKDTVRIKYFVQKSDAQIAEEIIKKFIKDKGLSEISPSSPRVETIAQGHGGETQELSFRRFLALETCIGLELTEDKTNLKEIQSLMEKFRQKNPCGSKNIGKSSEVSSLFGPTFEHHSRTFRYLKLNKSFFWSGLSKHDWDWPHFFVSLVHPELDAES